MVALYPVGKSSYGELRGLTQYVVDPLVAAHVNALIEESKSVFGAGAVLSVNEGNRSRARQKYLRGKWEDYRFNGGPWAALAAALYTSTHDESRGNAIDFGVTTRTGDNRSLTMSEHAWLVARGKAHGVIWTGGDPTFMRPAELWHFNGYPARATIPASSGAVIIPDTPTTPNVSEEDDDMKHLILVNSKDPADTNKVGTHWFVQNLADHTYYWVQNAAQVDWMKALGVQVKENQSAAVFAGFRKI